MTEEEKAEEQGRILDKMTSEYREAQAKLEKVSAVVIGHDVLDDGASIKDLR
jgi:hypothetical protein